MQREIISLTENRLRFPRKNRIVSKADYTHTLDQPHKVSQKCLLVLFKPNHTSIGRLGLMVGKRVASHAVTRNRIKRVIRESFRAKQDQLKGLDMVVIARQHCDKLNKVELREGLDKLWERIITQYRGMLSS